MMREPHLGQVVIYNSKIGDGVQSPALIIRTAASTNRELVQSWIDSGGGAEVTSKDGRHTHVTAEVPEGVRVDLDRYEVDLVVFGLGRTYREYGVPVFNPVYGGVEDPFNGHTWQPVAGAG